MIRLKGSAFDIATRFFVASGALGFDGRGYWFELPQRLLGRIRPERFVVVLKTLTFEKVVGNLNWRKRFGGCVRLLDTNGDALNEFDYLFRPSRIAGVVNAVGLTNMGYLEWVHQWRLCCPELIRDHQIQPVVSILAKTPEEAREMTKNLRVCPGIVGIEVNISCVNTDDGRELMRNIEASVGIVETVKEYAGDWPVLVKVSADSPFIEIVRRTAPAAVSFNSVPWKMVFPDRSSPLRSVVNADGGVSGKLAQPILWDAVKKLVHEVPEVPVIGPSVWDYGDVATLMGQQGTDDLGLGASAVHFGGIHLRGLFGSTLPTRYVNRFLCEQAQLEEDRAGHNHREFGKLLGD